MNKIVVAAAGMLFLLASVAGCKKDNQVEIPGTVAALAGTVTINDEPAELGDNVAVGDVVAASEDSWCDITFAGRNVFRILPDSSIVYDMDAESKGFTLINGFTGVHLAESEELSLFEVQTETITAGVRGTTFFLGYQDDGSVYACICNGKIEYYTDLDGEKIEAEGVHHSASVFRIVEDDVVQEDGFMGYHDDALMESIAGTVDSTIDWGVKSH
jgi:hypothetical protein